MRHETYLLCIHFNTVLRIGQLLEVLKKMEKDRKLKEKERTSYAQEQELLDANNSPPPPPPPPPGDEDGGGCISSSSAAQLGPSAPSINAGTITTASSTGISNRA